jgi:hypothetical protein
VTARKDRLAAAANQRTCGAQHSATTAHIAEAHYCLLSYFLGSHTRAQHDFVVQNLIITQFRFAFLDDNAESSRERFSGGSEMTGALLFGAVCGYIIALIFVPIPSTDEKDQIEKAQKDQKEQIEKAQKDQQEEIEKKQKDWQEKIEKQQKEKSNSKSKSKHKEKSEQTYKSWFEMASGNEINFCIKNCSGAWRLYREWRT